VKIALVRGEKDPARRLARRPKGLTSPLREIRGNLTRGSDGTVTAWFILPDVRWSLLSPGQRQETLDSLESAWAALAGHDLRIRVTQRPHPAAQWARGFLHRTWADRHPHARVRPANPAALTEYAVDVQNLISGSMNVMDSVVYLGVSVGEKRTLDRVAVMRRGDPEAARLRRDLRVTLAEVTERVTASVLAGRPATADDLCWLQHKSIGLGLPEPVLASPAGELIAATDLYAFGDGVGVDPRPGSDTIRLTARTSRNGRLDTGGAIGRPAARIRPGMRILLEVDGSETPVTVTAVDARAGSGGHRRIGWVALDGRSATSTFHGDAPVRLAPPERYVAVLSVGRMEAQQIPGQHAPWLALAQRVPFPVEISAHVQAVEGAKARKSISTLLHLILDQQEQRARFGERVDRESIRVAEQAETVLDRVEHGSEREAVEYRGVYRVAVAGVTPDEALERARTLAALYRAAGITLEHPEGQAGLHSEFDLAAKPVTSAYTRHMFGDLFAAAVPNLGARVGDDQGIFLGHTTGTVMRPVFWDPHRALYERETSGLTPIVAGLGGGKSVLAGMLAFYTALSGAEVTILDPSGPMARLAYHPAIREHAAHVDLLRSPAGTLSPFSVIPDPRREDHDSDEAWEDARLDVARRRLVLAGDVALMLLDHETRRDPRTRRVMRAAVQTLRGSRTESLSDVVHALRSVAPPVDIDAEDADWAPVLARTLDNQRTAPHAALLWAPGYMVKSDTARARLLVITMAGLTLPEVGSDEETWTDDQRMAVPLMHVAAHLATRRIYDAPMSAPKVLVLDEMHWLARSSSGRALLGLVLRDSRKWRTRVLVPTQNPSDILSVGAGVDNLVNEVFAGRLESPSEADPALGLMDVAASDAHRKILGRLSAAVGGTQPPYREFGFRDGEGRTEIIRVVIVDPVLKAALDPEDQSFDVHLPARLVQRLTAVTSEAVA
jgi:hypothetical protein